MENNGRYYKSSDETNFVMFTDRPNLTDLNEQ